VLIFAFVLHISEIKKKHLGDRVSGIAGVDSSTEVAWCWPDSCWPETRKHHAGWPDPISLSGQGHRLWISKFYVAGCLFNLSSVEILQVCDCFFVFHVSACLHTGHINVVKIHRAQLVLDWRWPFAGLPSQAHSACHPSMGKHSDLY